MKTTDKYVLYGVSDGPKYAQVDLGQAYDVIRVNIRNDWGAAGFEVCHGHEGEGNDRKYHFLLRGN